MKILGLEIKRQQPQQTESRKSMVDKLIGDWNVNFFARKTQNISERSMNYLPTVWRCIEIISTSIAGLPLAVKKETAEGIERVLHPIERLLKKQANPYMTAYTWKELMMRDVLTYGNHYSLIERTGGRVTGLYPVPCDDMDVKLVGRDLFYYVESMKDADPFASYEVLHIKGPSMDGICGMSLIEYHRHTFSQGLSASQYIREFYENDGQVKGIIKHPGKAKPETGKNVRDSWLRLYGPGGSRVAFLDGGMEYQQVSLPPSDALYLETVQYSDRQICNIYGVPLAMVNDLSDSHYNNIEHTGRQFVTYTLMPWVNRVESEFDCKLLTEKQKADHFVDFDPAGLMRGDMAAQAEYYMKMVQSRIMNANEVRKELNLNPYEGGDEYNNPNIDKNENDRGNQE